MQLNLTTVKMIFSESERIFEVLINRVFSYFAVNKAKKCTNFVINQNFVVNENKLFF